MTAPSAALAPEQRPASDLVLADMTTCVKNVREHQHPERGEDLYCLNLTSYMGERMAAVLKRLDDERAEVRQWKDRHTALAEEAGSYLDRAGELEAEVGPRPLDYGTGCRCDWLGKGTPEHAPSPLCRSLRPDADRDDDPHPAGAEDGSSFYEPGCTYASSEFPQYEWRFRCDAITTHPLDGERTALGWRLHQGNWGAYAYGEDDWAMDRHRVVTS